MMFGNMRWIVGAFIAVIIAGGFSTRAMADEKKDKDKEENEVKVTIDQVPPIVKATLMKEAGDGKITDIDKETDKGKVIYEADVKIGKNNYEIKVAEDGTLISKKLDNEEDEKDARDKNATKKRSTSDLPKNNSMPTPRPDCRGVAANLLNISGTQFHHARSGG